MEHPMAIIYHHRHGTDIIPAMVSGEGRPPEITNEFLASLGVDNPELDEDMHEWAEWYPLGPINHWPAVIATEDK